MSRMGAGMQQAQRQTQTQQQSPRLYQAMEMLHMPLHDLQTRLEQELSQNPFLELADEAEDDEETNADDDSPDDAGEPDEDAEEEPPEEEIDWDEVLRDGFEATGPREQYEEREHYERPVVGARDLRDHLNEQLGYLRLDERERWIAEEIVGNIDDDGLLSCALEDVVAGLDATRERERDPALARAAEIDDEEEREHATAEIRRLFAPHGREEVERVLGVVQRLDPPGVGARDLQECLQLQLAREGRADTLAGTIVADHFDALARHLWTDMARALGVTPLEVQDAADEIGRLDPRPGRRHSPEPDRYVVPDLVVDKVDGEYLVFVNDAGLPRLRLAERARSLARTHREVTARRAGQGDEDRYKEDRKFIAEKMNAATWLIGVMEQRRKTMLGVMRYIVKQQMDFFEKGTKHLRPLTLREVAEKVELAESTISRVANAKYVQSPAGVHPLRFFFSGEVTSSTEKPKSRRGVQSMVQDLITNEDPHSPLTDDAIVGLLREAGVKIARRTVAKYRSKLGILPARMRKRIR